MSTSLVAVNALIKEAADLWAQGESYMARAGQKYIAAREAAGGYTQAYRAALKRAGVAQSTEREAIQFAKDPQAEIEHKKKDAESARLRRATTSWREPAQEIKEIASKGEIHEATRGFVAMIKKAAKAGDEKDWRTSHQRRVVAFQHFKLLLSQSNLPALMNMTPDEIIELIRTI